jgi:hypothetical protein
LVLYYYLPEVEIGGKVSLTMVKNDIIKWHGLIHTEQRGPKVTSLVARGRARNICVGFADLTHM